jgi:ribosomal-protein-alanine N-acetyltransferase
LAGYHSLVIDLSGIVIGYGIMSVAAGEAHILNICVHPDLQRRGYGGRMLAALLMKAEQAEAAKVFLEVRPSNEAALRLYRGVGFDQIGIRPAYYQSVVGREDAVVLALTLRTST